MDFVVGLPRTRAGFDAIWVIVDRLTKLAHFLPIHNNFSLDRFAELYINEIVRLYGIPVPLCQIEILDLHLDFGQSFKRHWAPLYILALLFTQKLMVNLKGPFKL